MSLTQGSVSIMYVLRGRTNVKVVSKAASIMRVSSFAHMFVCRCVCVSVCETQRDRQTDREGERHRERLRERDRQTQREGWKLEGEGGIQTDRWTAKPVEVETK